MSMFKALLNGMDWRPIGDYRPADDGAVLLTGSRGLLIGQQVDGAWCQLLDGGLIPLERFEPAHFAGASDEIIAELTAL